MLRWGLLPIMLGLGLLAAATLALYEFEPTTLRVAVAPRDGTEPELLAAFASALAEGKEDIRLVLTVYDDVEASAAALDAGKADLAVVRPDVALPARGLTVAVLRDQALMIASPASSGLTSFPKLAGKRLGLVSHRGSDSELLRSVLTAYALDLRSSPDSGAPGGSEVSVTVLDEQDTTAALKAKRVDAVVSVIAPTAPRAIDAIHRVAAATPSGKVAFVSTDEQDALVERFPLLQSVTVPGGLFGGRPAVPADDVKTIGVSYRLMARVSVSRAVVASLTQHLFELRSQLARATPAAYYVAAPSYDTTAAATSARLPNHPGAIDYYERDQHGFIDRYSDTLYFLALVASGMGSVFAWARQRVSRFRRERIEEITDRLLEIAGEAGATGSCADIGARADEIETLAVDAARWSRDHEPSQRVTTAMSLALDAARRKVERELTAQGTLDDRPIPSATNRSR